MGDKIFYVVTDGCYSDYYIITVTDDKAKAEHIAQIFDARVEKYCDSIITERDKVFNVNINKTTNEIIEIKEVHDSYRIEHINTIREVIGSVYTVVCAEDEGHAKKVALDKYYEWKAERENVL